MTVGEGSGSADAEGTAQDRLRDESNGRQEPDGGPAAEAAVRTGLGHAEQTAVQKPSVAVGCASAGRQAGPPHFGLEIDGRQECFRIAPGRGRQTADHPGVAAFLLRGFDAAAGEPHRRMPPVETGDDVFQETHPVVAAAKVDQFVREERVAHLGRESRQELAREEHDRASSPAPQHGRADAGRQLDRWRPRDPQCLRNAVGGGRNVRRRFLRGRHTRAETDDLAPLPQEPGAGAIAHAPSIHAVGQFDHTGCATTSSATVTGTLKSGGVTSFNSTMSQTACRKIGDRAA